MCFNSQLVLPQPDQDEIDEGDQDNASDEQHHAKVHYRHPYGVNPSGETREFAHFRWLDVLFHTVRSGPSTASNAGRDKTDFRTARRTTESIVLVST
jgi:hypothetical protein